MSEKRNQNTFMVREKYNRSSSFYDLMEFPMEFFWFRRWRKRLFRSVRGPRVLEVGIGTGKNLKYYTQKFWAIGMDLSEGMMSKAKPLAKAKGISMAQMDAQHLAFRDNTFDTVVVTFVFCSVPDPIKGLKEIRRVVKPDGQILLLEHVLPKYPLLARIFNKLDSFISTRSGVHINRKTSENIRISGFKLNRDENLLFSIFRFFCAKPIKENMESHQIRYP